MRIFINVLLIVFVFIDVMLFFFYFVYVIYFFMVIGLSELLYYFKGWMYIVVICFYEFIVFYIVLNWFIIFLVIFWYLKVCYLNVVKRYCNFVRVKLIIGIVFVVIILVIVFFYFYYEVYDFLEDNFNLIGYWI